MYRVKKVLAGFPLFFVCIFFPSWSEQASRLWIVWRRIFLPSTQHQWRVAQGKKLCIDVVFFYVVIFPHIHRLPWRPVYKKQTRLNLLIRPLRFFFFLMILIDARVGVPPIHRNWVEIGRDSGWLIGWWFFIYTYSTESFGFPLFPYGCPSLPFSLSLSLCYIYWNIFPWLTPPLPSPNLLFRT